MKVKLIASRLSPARCFLRAMRFIARAALARPVGVAARSEVTDARIANMCTSFILSSSSCTGFSFSEFMGLPFAGVLWNSQFKAAGNPTYFIDLEATAQSAEAGSV
jgi:hypothetical protein